MCVCLLAWLLQNKVLARCVAMYWLALLLLACGVHATKLEAITQWQMTNGKQSYTSHAQLPVPFPYGVMMAFNVSNVLTPVTLHGKGFHNHTHGYTIFFEDGSRYPNDTTLNTIMYFPQNARAPPSANDTQIISALPVSARAFFNSEACNRTSDVTCVHMEVAHVFLDNERCSGKSTYASLLPSMYYRATNGTAYNTTDNSPSCGVHTSVLGFSSGVFAYYVTNSSSGVDSVVGCPSLTQNTFDAKTNSVTLRVNATLIRDYYENSSTDNITFFVPNTIVARTQAKDLTPPAYVLSATQLFVTFNNATDELREDFGLVVLPPIVTYINPPNVTYINDYAQLQYTQKIGVRNVRVTTGALYEIASNVTAQRLNTPYAASVLDESLYGCSETTIPDDSVTACRNFLNQGYYEVTYNINTNELMYTYTVDVSYVRQLFLDADGEFPFNCSMYIAMYDAEPPTFPASATVAQTFLVPAPVVANCPEPDLERIVYRDHASGDIHTSGLANYPNEAIRSTSIGNLTAALEMSITYVWKGAEFDDGYECTSGNRLDAIEQCGGNLFHASTDAQTQGYLADVHPYNTTLYPSCIGSSAPNVSLHSTCPRPLLVFDCDLCGLTGQRWDNAYMYMWNACDYDACTHHTRVTVDVISLNPQAVCSRWDSDGYNPELTMSLYATRYGVASNSFSSMEVLVHVDFDPVQCHKFGIRINMESRRRAVRAPTQDLALTQKLALPPRTRSLVDDLSKFASWLKALQAQDARTIAQAEVMLGRRSVAPRSYTPPDNGLATALQMRFVQIDKFVLSGYTREFIDYVDTLPDENKTLALQNEYGVAPHEADVAVFNLFDIPEPGSYYGSSSTGSSSTGSSSTGSSSTGSSSSGEHASTELPGTYTPAKTKKLLVTHVSSVAVMMSLFVVDALAHSALYFFT